jgi:uncharacterized protein YndB with AHSA1/START domain
MATIRHRIGVSAQPVEVYACVGTVPGLARWWTPEVKGDAALGGTLAFSFGGPAPAAIMEVTENSPEKCVRWRCIEGPDDWVDSEITFEITSVGEETILRFSHAWPSADEFMYHCSTKWGYFLLGLKSALDGGEATPFPGDLKISAWG